MSSVAQPTITADELLRMPDGDRFELVDGELVERDMGTLAGWISNQVGALFDRYAKQHGGIAFGEGAWYRCYEDDPERVRKPDASYIRSGRLPGDEIPEGYITISPDVAVEVISPSDTYRDVEAKVAEYLDAGVPLVWLINPDNQSVRVFRAGQRVVQLRATDELTGDDVLPGFRCPVAELFPPQTAAKSKAP
ncbi:MAG: Uma2 family endonuclease [Candidatus Saccharimonas sp.]|nr:Uma2 family endonuclease [Planctomycetaceae bacterium]